MLPLQVCLALSFSRQTRGEAFANLTIDKQINTPFLFQCVSPSSCYSALWRPFMLSLALSLSRSLCVCAATRPAVCATLNGAESGARRRRGRLLTAEFAFARFVLYTENCHKYTRSNEEHTHPHAQAYACTYVCMHSYSHDCDYSYLFIICFLLQKIRKTKKQQQRFSLLQSGFN